MSAQIQMLSDALINKIAAGEVVERPASVVKELVENSLDAGASEIKVEMAAGGRQLLRVVDDGVGMDRANARLALARHATSKIVTDDDLFGIRTLGFRGEALAAIAGVSKFELITRRREDELGVHLKANGGDVTSFEDVGCPAGTEIVVRELFYNTPARLKFLRSVTVEGGHVVDVVTRLALAQEGVGFTLSRGRDALIRVARQSAGRDRIFEVLGHRVGEHMFEVAGEKRACSVHGFASSPALSRSGWTGFYVFVNGRSLRDRTVMRSVAEAYRGILPRGRYPMVVLHIDIPPEEVDVNVHPGKLEVRFARSRLVAEHVVDTLRRGLGAAPWRKGKKGDGGFQLVSPAERRPAPVASEVVAHKAPEARKGGGAPSPYHRAEGAEQWTLIRDRPRPAQTRPPEPPLPPEPPPYVSHEAASAPSPRDLDEVPPEAPPEVEATVEPEVAHPPEPTFSAMRFVGSYGGSHALCESDGELVFIDLHVARECRLEQALSGPEAGRRGQPLLIPRVVDLKAREAAALDGALDALKALGLDVEPFGGGSFAVKAMPQALIEADAEALLRDVVGQLLATGDVASLSTVRRVMIGHGGEGDGALKPGPLRALIKGLDGADPDYRCPHGRRLAAKMGRREIERLFKRR